MDDKTPKNDSHIRGRLAPEDRLFESAFAMVALLFSIIALADAVSSRKSRLKWMKTITVKGGGDRRSDERGDIRVQQAGSLPPQQLLASHGGER